MARRHNLLLFLLFFCLIFLIAFDHSQFDVLGHHISNFLFSEAIIGFSIIGDDWKLVVGDRGELVVK